ncbi:tripartite tricarboxylate transporter TctB family protein [Pokkaliibacter sp. MBI-7]|uniref:tripartite tricarboxylate transporter TctB family protein n=1 Tax=Pokkaliibacter sp. MBI-7 TaxID=3040600 RepID=UPI00244D3A54|nr:tripartite tricarboxylate transporter TctB family protein [Pokkaliibacter sp. MBI-7]MDH2433562.1 tripartite tricarboxylate transporter TctB family protein [Pokkaliibacter sp. MBI-7]
MMKATTHVRAGEVIFTLLLLAVSAFLLFEAYGIAALSSWSSPGAMPLFSTGIMVVTGIYLVFNGAQRGEGREASVSLAHHLGAAVAHLFRPVVLSYCVLLVLYLLALSYIGFFYSSALFLFVSFMVLWQQGVVKAAGITAISLGAVYVIFQYLFSVVLP